MAVRMSVRLGWLDSRQEARFTQLIGAADLPDAPPSDMTSQQFLDLMAVDKKVRDGVINLVLVKQLGTAVVTGDYPADTLQVTLDSYFSRDG